MAHPLDDGGITPLRPQPGFSLPGCGYGVPLPRAAARTPDGVSP
jgi:hypothetical protein